MVLYLGLDRPAQGRAAHATAATSGRPAPRPKQTPRHRRAGRSIIAAPLFRMNGLFSAKLVMINGGTGVLMTAFTARSLHPRHRPPSVSP